MEAMTIVSLKTGSDNSAGTVKIVFSDNSSLTLRSCYLEHYSHAPSSLEIGMELSSAEEDALKFASNCFRAECTAMRLIARAEQTSTGLSHKLERRGYQSACVSAVIARLVDQDLVNDRRYAERWLRSRLTRKTGRIRGPRHLSAALGNRSIDRRAIKEALDNVLDDETEYELLQRFLAKNRTNSISQAYLRSYLRYEGFSSPAINLYFEAN